MSVVAQLARGICLGVARRILLVSALSVLSAVVSVDSQALAPWRGSGRSARCGCRVLPSGPGRSGKTVVGSGVGRGPSGLPAWGWGRVSDLSVVWSV